MVTTSLDFLMAYIVHLEYFIHSFHGLVKLLNWEDLCAVVMLMQVNIPYRNFSNINWLEIVFSSNLIACQLLFSITIPRTGRLYITQWNVLCDSVCVRETELTFRNFKKYTFSTREAHAKCFPPSLFISCNIHTMLRIWEFNSKAHLLF